MDGGWFDDVMTSNALLVPARFHVSTRVCFLHNGTNGAICVRIPLRRRATGRKYGENIVAGFSSDQT